MNAWGGWGSSWGTSWAAGADPIVLPEVAAGGGGGGRPLTGRQNAFTNDIDSEEARDMVAAQNLMAIRITLDAIACGLFDEL